ncbi:Mitogen-activated protein kinase kinase kinase 20 [Linum grandiflorum]
MEWLRGKLLGKGSFGEVYLGIPVDPTQAPTIAVKSAPGHANVNLFMEYAEKGSLSNLISRFGPLPEYYVRGCTRALLKAICLIHKSGFIHCDIKPDNILICEDTNGNDPEVKIADFGLAVEEGMMPPRAREIRGTLEYMPPEVSTGGMLTKSMDVWALGCTIIEMITANRPWIGEVTPELVIPQWMSLQGQDFLAKCFSGMLYSSEMLLSHPYITGNFFLEKHFKPIRMTMTTPPLLPHQMYPGGIFHKDVFARNCFASPVRVR